MNMTDKEKEKVTLNPAIGVAGEQPSTMYNRNIITDKACSDNLQAVDFKKIFDYKIDKKVMDVRDGLSTISMAELYETVYPPKSVLVDGFLYAGTYLFVGAPKVGKSFFMAQLGYYVAKGLPLWNNKVHQGTVLYLALEDDYARLQKRLSRMFGVDGTEKLHFATQAKAVSNGLDYQLDCFVKEHPDARLIIIDTLQKVREVSSDGYGYASDYEIVTKLKAFSDKHNICLLVVHHTRKMSSEDSFDMISGTNGLLGAADGAFIVQKKKRTDNQAVMDIVGRDQQDLRLTLEFDREHCLWNMIKMETELWRQPPDPLLEVINQFLEKTGGSWKGTPTELIGLLENVDLQPNVLTRKLNVSAERLFNEYGIRYESSRNHDGRCICLSKENDVNDEKLER